MSQNQLQNKNETTEINLGKLLGVLWHRAWLLILCTVIGAAIAFGYSSQFITPKYRSNIQLYVDNVNNGITASGLAAAQSLVGTYIEILKSRPSLEKIIEEAELDMTTAELSGMISAKGINATEIFEISVSGEDRMQTVVIANAIATVFPDVIKSVIRHAQIGVVEWADGSDHQYAPNITRNTILGGLIGFLFCCVAILLKHYMNPYITSEEDIVDTYGIPLLAIIPVSDSRRSLKRSKYGKYGYYGNTTYSQKKEK